MYGYSINSYNKICQLQIKQLNAIRYKKSPFQGFFVEYYEPLGLSDIRIITVTYAAIDQKVIRGVASG